MLLNYNKSGRENVKYSHAEDTSSADYDVKASRMKWIVVYWKLYKNKKKVFSSSSEKLLQFLFSYQLKTIAADLPSSSSNCLPRKAMQPDNPTWKIHGEWSENKISTDRNGIKFRYLFNGIETEEFKYFIEKIENKYTFFFRNRKPKESIKNEIQQWNALCFSARD